MKILILEDSAERMEFFYKKFEDSEIRHVEHAKDAIEALENNQYDIIFLDHDLGGTQMNYDPKDCGTLVAEYLSENPVDSKIIIHSFNPVAANRMINILHRLDVKYIPGAWLDEG